MTNALKKILITGSNGLLGQKLVYALLKRKDISLVATSKSENRLREKSGYLYESLDITDKEQVKEVIGRHLPDVIINTAAMTNVDACEFEKDLCWNLNVSAVKNFVDLIENAKNNTGIPLKKIADCHFIHLSTDFVFDGENGPYKETDAPNPLSYYSISKYEAEKILQQSNIKWTIIRTIIVYGIVDNMSRSNVVLWAKEALEKKKEIKVVNDQFRAPTLAEDLAEGCISTAIKGATGIYHVAGKDIMSILELTYKVADFWKLDKSLIKPVRSNSLSQPAKRPPRTGFILDKARMELNYQPHSFEEGLKILDRQMKTMAEN